MENEVRQAVNNQLEPGERLVWSGQPDGRAAVTKILILSLLLLSAIFAESISLVAAASSDVEALLAIRIAGLAFFAGAAACMLFLAPKRAARVAYAVTNRRVFKIDLNCSVFGRRLDRVKHLSHAIIHERRSFPEAYWFCFTAHSFLLCAWLAAFLPSVAESGDLFMILANVLLIVALAAFIYDRNYLPDARWREPASLLFWIGSRCVNVQDIRLKDVCDVKVRSGRSGTQDLFVLTRTSGCLRLPYVDSPEGAKHLATTFGAEEGAADAG
jgi:hypothetical protein